MSSLKDADNENTSCILIGPKIRKNRRIFVECAFRNHKKIVKENKPHDFYNK